MKKIIGGVAAAIVIFAAVTAFVIWQNFNDSSANLGSDTSSSLRIPAVYFTFMDRNADWLRGYVNRSDSIEAANLLLPVDESGLISINISAGETLVDSVLVEIYSLDQSRLLESVQTAIETKDGYKTEYTLTALADEGETYLMVLELSLSNSEKVYYSVKICQYGEEYYADKEELIGYLEDFSDSACQNDKDAVAGSLSYDKDKAGTDLHYVNMYTPSDLVAWKNMTVHKNVQYLQIYEWYDTQLSAGLKYTAQLSCQDETDFVTVTENFCLRKRDGKIFLLDYERNTSERFELSAESVGQTSVLLGIQDGNTLDLMYSDYGLVTYFTVDGQVFCYDYNENCLTRIFSCGSDNTDMRLDPNAYTVRLVRLLDGVLYFTVSGYIESGEHEGENGFALYGYDTAQNVCREYLYTETSAKSSTGMLSFVNNEGLYYVNIGGSIYSADLSGNDILKLYENIDEGSLAVNEDRSLAAFRYEDDENTLYLLDADSKEMVSFTAQSGICAFGFVEDDLVYGEQSEWKLEKEGFVLKGFYDRVCIAGKDKTIKAEYEKENILVSDVIISDTGVSLVRYEKDGDTVKEIDNDVLTIAKDEEEGVYVELKLASSENKGNYYYINLGRTVSTVKEIKTASRTANATVISGQETKNESKISAALYGRITEYDTFSNAAGAVYDGFGSVYLAGFLSDEIWNRDARELYLTVTLPVMSWTLEGHEEEMAAMTSLERGVDILVYAGVNAAAADEQTAKSSQREECESVCEELTLCFGDRLVLIENDTDLLLYYLNLRHPVLCLTNEDESLMVTGYTSDSLSIYDPATRETDLWSKEDAQAYFDSVNAIFVTFW